MTKRVLPDGAFEQHVYNADGTRASRRDFKGEITSFEYDDNQRLVSRRLPDNTLVSMEYSKIGQRTKVTDSRGETIFAYDSRDRLISKTVPGGDRIDYAYDESGNLIMLTLSVGETSYAATYGYDALDRMISLEDGAGQVYTFRYDENGNRKILTFPTGISTAMSFNQLNRLVELSTTKSDGEVLQSYSYDLDDAGNRTRIDEHDGGSRIYAYDTTYQLLREEARSGDGSLEFATDFAYDAVGNRISKTATDGSGATQDIAYAYDNRNRLVSEGGTVNYSWDANRNLIGKTGSTADASYSWDHENRLTGVMLDDGSVLIHEYDADGNWVGTDASLADGTVVDKDFLVGSQGGMEQILAEVDHGENRETFLARGHELLGQTEGADARFYHADGLGSVRLLSDPNQDIVGKSDYSAFGELLGGATPGTPSYLYAGAPLEATSGLYQMRARWMDPSVGRFLSIDPATDTKFLLRDAHHYTYVRNNPTNFVDPTGLFGVAGQVAVSAAIGAIVNVAVGLNAQSTFESIAWDFFAGAIQGALFHGVAVAAIKLIAFVGRLSINAFRIAKARHVLKAMQSVLARVTSRGPLRTATLKLGSGQTLTITTQVPKYFTLRTPLGDVFVNPNATKHMVEIIAGKLGRGGAAATSEATFALMVKSLEQAISRAAIQGGSILERLIVANGWELKFVLARPGEPVKLVLKYARWLVF